MNFKHILAIMLSLCMTLTVATFPVMAESGYVPGDVNCDGAVNNKDLGVLRRYLNDWDVEIEELASDVNADGSVNNKDLGLLRRYLNDWDVELKYGLTADTRNTTQKISAANEINSDVVGWINISGTNIDYPVLQDPNGKTNDFSQLNKYYETRDLYKQTNKNASIFADDWNTIGSKEELDRNTILYGHNWTNIEKNGAEVRMNNEEDVMFGQLPMLANLEFAKKTPTITFATEKDDITWVVFAVSYIDPNELYYVNESPNDVDFMRIVSGTIQRSEHIYDVDVQLSDKILTLSTCTRRLGNNDKQRFVVMARMLRDGESVESFAEPVDNPAPLRPTWYTGDR